MTTDMSFDMMEKILPYVVEINGDEDVQQARKSFVDTKGDNDPYALMQAMLPLLLQRHRRAVYALVATVSGKEISEVEEQPFKDTIADWKSAVDFWGDMTGFFIPAIRMVVRA